MLRGLSIVSKQYKREIAITLGVMITIYILYTK